MKSKHLLKKYFTLFFYLSLVFLVIYLLRYDYLRIQIDKLNYGYLGISFFFLFSGFLLNAFCWYLVCEKLSKSISLGDAISSYGLTIFGKYMPGKVWGLVGRAAYVSRAEGSLKTATQLSFYTQFLSIWVGGGLGLIGLVVIKPLLNYLWAIVLLWVLLTIIIFLPQQKLQFLNNVTKKFNRDNHPLTHFTNAAHNLPTFFLFWLCWTLAFIFLIESLFPGLPIAWYTSLAFPFATTLGIMAFIAPGGLGVRESFMVFYLVHSGMSLEDATLVSVVSRVWFIVGEIFIFIVAICLKYHFLKKLMSNSSQNAQ
ncbi:MAG: lysylphosphatidylglycerol synthase transmembrane domain-containing protein [Pseudomonadota bacterium]